MYSHMNQDIAEKLAEAGLIHDDPETEDSVIKIMNTYYADYVAIVWGVGDVLTVAKNIHIEITDEQAREILHELPQDASIGINWDVIETVIQQYT